MAEEIKNLCEGEHFRFTVAIILPSYNEEIEDLKNIFAPLSIRITLSVSGNPGR
jgi:hypothetical protein